MDSLALRKHMLPPSTKMAAYSVSLRPWPVSNTLLSFILASLLTGMAPIPKTVGLVKLGKQAFLCGLAARWGSLLSPNTARYSVLRTAAPPSVKRIRSEESTWRRMAGSPTRMSAGRSQEHQVPGGYLQDCWQLPYNRARSWQVRFFLLPHPSLPRIAPSELPTLPSPQSWVPALLKMVSTTRPWSFSPKS
ncbi:tetratricopeptide repeat protein 31 isoform X2 [Bubalus bubalis]|uniref:tetratricopeptide repeat protein 31 isoform X2 n=1 Tax=Bubalus bubalis TaxID=89462 RepID=UPI001D103577|nr:tetratricopeptide repeat protein 31 isoform X2 [Bubalus bubalis]